MSIIDDSEYEVVTMDEQTENVARILTLVIKKIKPQIDCGETYEHVAHLLVKFMYEEVNDEDAEITGHNILNTIGLTKRAKH